MRPTLLAPTDVPSVVPSAGASAEDVGAAPGELPEALTGAGALAGHWAPTSLASRLNAEWLGLCQAAASDLALSRWAARHAALAGYRDLPSLLRAVTHGPRSRDAVLLALLELAQAGERLAGRVVLQAMLGRAVRMAMAIVRRPDVLGDREEAQARAVAALWQVIATYPLAARPGRVAANLALDLLAVVQRGHTGSSWFTPVFPEQSFADLSVLAHVAWHDADRDEPGGPVDAELLGVLAWGVRAQVLTLAEARLLARVYGCDGTAVQTGAVAAELGVSGPALRQRCHRLARRLGRAAVDAGVTATGQDGAGGLLSAA